MPSRKIRTLNERQRARIKKNYATLRRDDFAGEALIYLNRVRGAAKSRKIKEGKIAQIDELVIPKDSQIYRIIEKGAKANKMSVKKFVEKYKEDIIQFMQDGDIVGQRATDYLISDIGRLKSGKKVFVNDGNGYVKIPPLKDIFNIQRFTQHIVENSDIFLIIYRVHYKLNGDLSHYLPDPEEYEELDDQELLEEMIGSYYPNITFVASAKKEKKTDSSKTRKKK